MTPHQNGDPTAGDTATVDASEPAATTPTRRERFRAWRRTRPFWGGLLVVVAGFELFGSGQLDFGHLHLQFGIQGLQATVIPIVLVLLGVLIWTMPVHRVFYGVIALVLSVYALIGVNLGGFLIGMVLGIVGSVMALSWMPQEATTDEAVEPEAARPRHAESLNLTGNAPSTDDTLVLEDSSAPRPFSVAPAEAGIAPRRRARLNAIGAGVLASALSVGGTGLVGAGAIPVAATASAEQSGWCVLDPLHVFCPADDDSASDGATSAPSESPTSTGTPTEDPTSDGATSDGGATDTGASAPTGGGATDEGAGSTGGDAPSSSGTDGTQDDAAAGDATKDAEGEDSAKDDKADGTTDEQSVKEASKDGVAALADELKLCLGEGKDLGSSSTFTAPNLSAHLSGSKFQITNSWYKGNVSLKRVDGSTVRVMKFTADKAVVPGFRLDVPAKADGSQGLVATSDSITMKGDVVLYATKFSGKLLGIPLTFTPECAPPGFIPLPSMTDVKIEMVANTAESLAYDNPHQEVYEH